MAVKNNNNNNYYYSSPIDISWVFGFITPYILPLLTVHLLNLLSFSSTCTNNLYLMSLRLVDTYNLSFHRVNSPTTSSISTLKSWIPLISPLHLIVCPSRYTWRKSQQKKRNVPLLWNHWTLLSLWCIFVFSRSLPSFLCQRSQLLSPSTYLIKSSTNWISYLVNLFIWTFNTNKETKQSKARKKINK